ncbi:hypothetical protein [Mesorhizobium sp. M0590]|uniref:hypothetical protein n=1 Tax=Mesorhizobium sp. M0590 TaxID=2956966 RepID=UPI00333621DE
MRVPPAFWHADVVAGNAGDAKGADGQRTKPGRYDFLADPIAWNGRDPVASHRSGLPLWR